ncbi:MAG: radical SAM protein [Nanoarchaeota archaeon]|nr:radical SAM protein [Nanoarchaeota archaeon]
MNERIIHVLKNIPVSINCQLGDPFQATQWEDTLEKIVSLEKSKHQGPVGIMTKSLLNASQIKVLKKSPLDIWLFMTITGLDENKSLNFEKIKKNYLKVCKVLKHVVVYLRPIVPGKNDNLKVIQPIIKLASLGHQIVVARGFKDVTLEGRPAFNSEEFINLLEKECLQNNVKMYRKTICAVSDILNHPCRVHENIKAKNVAFIQQMGYPIQLVKGELLPDKKLGGDSYGWTRGDKNFIKIVCYREPKLPKLKNTSLLSLKFNNTFLDCTSSWFGWARQVKCTVNCWYCIAAWNLESSKLKNIGCNPSNLINLFENKKAISSKVSSVLKLIDELSVGGISYTPDARLKLVWHRENFTNFLKFKDELIRPVTAEFWPSLSCNARCSLCPYRANKAREEADKSKNITLTTLEIAKRVSSELANFGVKSVLMTGGGEPFMNPEIDKIARIFKDNGLKLGIYTNGTVPNREQQIKNIVELSPQFIRMSINAGSEEEHYKEYHIEPCDGKSSWQIVKQNVLLYLNTIKESGVNTSFGFSFVLLGNESPESYVGMANFISEIHELSGRLPLSAHFRPKFIYYNSEGIVIPEITGKMAENISNISKMVEKYVLPNLPKSPTLTIQKNVYAIKLVGEGAKAHACFSTGWATSFNHLGEGYILSELCGSKWEGAKWGDLMTQTMNDAWFSKERLKLHRDYATGKRKAPVYNKLTGVQNFLAELRAVMKKPFTNKEIIEFWKAFDKADYKKPSSWDFI